MCCRRWVLAVNVGRPGDALILAETCDRVLISYLTHDKFATMTKRTEWRRVYDALWRRLEDREWDVGAQIPTISELQREYQIRSLGTVLLAQRKLIEEGYLRSEHGRGVFVVAHPARHPGNAQSVAAAAAIEEAIRLLTHARHLLDQKTTGGGYHPDN
jgi:DNA-binding GntR family transcriptional regulator